MAQLGTVPDDMLLRADRSCSQQDDETLVEVNGVWMTAEAARDAARVAMIDQYNAAQKDFGAVDDGRD